MVGGRKPMKFESNVQTKPRRMVIIRNRGIISTAVLIVLVFIVYVCTLSLKTSSRQFEYASYPRTYAEYVEKEAKECHLEPALVYAVIKQESGFDPKCVSNAGAIGLMQIMPDTGEWAAKELGTNKFSTQDLLEPEKNLRIGTWYLNYLKRYFNGNDYLALASYNAGHRNVSRWIREGIWSGDSVKIEQIPFPETKKYLIKIILYRRIYSYLYPELKIS